MKRTSPMFRHEQKYLISDLEKDLLVKRFDSVMERDRHAQNGTYFIRSLYFDDQNNSAYYEKLGGAAVRKKYRIRCYDHKDDVIKLECKHKQGSYIYKESVSITRQELDQILNRQFDFLWEKKEAICRNFFLECVTNQMTPKVLVDYDRIPFVFSTGDVRVTFDCDVRESMFFGDLFSRELPSTYVLDRGMQIVEVKYTSCLPDFVKDLLTNTHTAEVAASKYVMCCDKKIERSGMLLPV